MWFKIICTGGERTLRGERHLNQMFVISAVVLKFTSSLELQEFISQRMESESKFII